MRPQPVDAETRRPLRIVVIGLSITSSWGNGHATTYRGLLRELTALGHDVLFLERDVPWYADNRDLPNPPYCRTELYRSLNDLKDRFICDVRDADVVVVGSYVPDGIAVGLWVTAIARGVTAFYDIDTPVTLAQVRSDRSSYLSRELITRFDLYLSFTGVPTLDVLEGELDARRAVPLYCSFDPTLYGPLDMPTKWDLGYMGTYSDDRQGPLDGLMLEAARRWIDGRMVVAGPQYPARILWPPNVERVEHLAPRDHRAFYASQRFTLNITRADMVRAGYSPSVRLFEAAACGTPIISDYWEGLDQLFTFGSEILVSGCASETLEYLNDIPERERRAIGERARARVMQAHTARHRALELESYVLEQLGAEQPTPLASAHNA